MSVLVPFIPPTLAAPSSFQATFDSASYTVSITWNYYGQRYYVTVTDASGNVVYNLPQIGSPPGYPINLNAGYFTTPCYYDVANTQFVIG